MYAVCRRLRITVSGGRECQRGHTAQISLHAFHRGAWSSGRVTETMEEGNIWFSHRLDVLCTMVSAANLQSQSQQFDTRFVFPS